MRNYASSIVFKRLELYPLLFRFVRWTDPPFLRHTLLPAPSSRVPKQAADMNYQVSFNLT